MPIPQRKTRDTSLTLANMPTVFDIADILVEHAAQAHAGEIAIIAYYGSHAKGLASATSDLDLFYIPDEGKAGALCSQFVIGGLPYDFWPISWRFAEEIASAASTRPWGVAASLIADAKVLFHRSDADLARFEALQRRILELTQPAKRADMIAKALDEYKNVLVPLGQLRLAAADGDWVSVHAAANRLVAAVANCLALLNQTYFGKGWGANMAEVCALPLVPPGFERLVRAVLAAASTDQLVAAADALAHATRQTLREAQPATAQSTTPAAVFKDFYFFVFEYVNKVVAACAQEDALKARFAAFQLHDEIGALMHQAATGVYPSEFNLLGEYQAAYATAGMPDLLTPAVAADLPVLAQCARDLDTRMQQWLTSHGVALNSLADEAALRTFLSERDPIPGKAEQNT